MPTYLVWCTDHGERPEDGREIKAIDGEDAAEIWAERDDQESADYAIGSGNEVTVVVREKTSGTEYRHYRYTVVGEAVPSYRACIINDADRLAEAEALLRIAGAACEPDSPEVAKRISAFLSGGG